MHTLLHRGETGFEFCSAPLTTFTAHQPVSRATEEGMIMRDYSIQQENAYDHRKTDGNVKKKKKSNHYNADITHEPFGILD